MDSIITIIIFAIGAVIGGITVHLFKRNSNYQISVFEKNYAIDLDAVSYTHLTLPTNDQV